MLSSFVRTLKSDKYIDYKNIIVTYSYVECEIGQKITEIEAILSGIS